MFTHVNSRHIRANPSVWLWLAWPGSGLACGTIHGHWKDSLIMGSNRSAIGTLAE